jgi:transcriptional regulator with XRE-family HTH domain
MRKPMHDDHWMRWGSMVRRRRREVLGHSRQDVAQQTGLSAATIRNLERGKVRRPASTTLRVLCGALLLPMPGEDGLYLSIDDVVADRLRKVTRDALDEYALRRRDPKRFVAVVVPNQTTQHVIRDRDLALRLRDLLRGIEDFSRDEAAWPSAAPHRCMAPGTRP